MSNRYILRGSSTQWFRNFLVRTFGGENVADAPSSRRAAPGLPVNNDIQPVLVVNSETGLELPDTVQINNVIVPTPSDPTKVYQGLPVVNAETPEGVRIPIEVSGGAVPRSSRFRVVRFSPQVSATTQGLWLWTVATNFPAGLTGIEPYGRLIAGQVRVTSNQQRVQEVRRAQEVTRTNGGTGETVRLAGSIFLVSPEQPGPTYQSYVIPLGVHDIGPEVTDSDAAGQLGVRLAAHPPPSLQGIPIPLSPPSAALDGTGFRLEGLVRFSNSTSGTAIMYPEMTVVIQEWATGAADYPYASEPIAYTRIDSV